MAKVEQLAHIRGDVAAALRDESVDGAAPAVWLSGQQAADHVGVSWPTLRQVIVDHGIPHVRLGRRWKIEASILDDHLRRLASTSSGRA